MKIRAIAVAAFALVTLASARVLASPQVELEPGTAEPAATAHHGGGIEWITPVFGHSGKIGLLWILINFAVLMWLLEKLLFSKLRASTKVKHDSAKTELQRATEAREQAEATLKKYESRLSGLEKEIGELMAEAKVRAEADRKRIVEAAEHEAAQIKASAIATAEREAGAMRRKLETEIVDRAVERAEKLIRERIGGADQTRMVDQFVTRLGSIDLTGNAKGAGT